MASETNKKEIYKGKRQFKFDHASEFRGDLIRISACMFSKTLKSSNK